MGRLELNPIKLRSVWGPRGFTLTTHSKDVRPGGCLHYTMHGPDGTDYVNKTVLPRSELYKKLVIDHGGGDDRPPMFLVTVIFYRIQWPDDPWISHTMRLPRRGGSGHA